MFTSERERERERQTCGPKCWWSLQALGRKGWTANAPWWLLPMLHAACWDMPFNGVYSQLCSQARSHACCRKDLECSSAAKGKENTEAGPRCRTENTARKRETDSRPRELQLEAQWAKALSPRSLLSLAKVGPRLPHLWKGDSAGQPGEETLI